MAWSSRWMRGGAPKRVAGSVEDNWERLVKATLKRDREGRASSSSDVLPSVGRLLQVADDIVGDDPNIARILCEQAYNVVQNLDPSSGLTGVLQFRAGLSTVIKQKLASRGGASFDRSNDFKVLWNFYLEYKKRCRVDDLHQEHERTRESRPFSTEMETRDVDIKNIYVTLRALLDALEILVGQAPTDRLDRKILEEVRAGIAAIQICEDSDELSPGQVNVLKKFLEDYCEVSQMESTLHHMPLQQLEDITDNFSHKLGRGGFGVVYKGMLENGQMVAVKKLAQSMPSSREQFENEATFLMNLKHPNIVRLVGYCYEMRYSHTLHHGKFVFASTAECLLCLECLINGSLDKYISDASNGLDWPTRFKIIEGISYGLQYLHEQSNGPIIHLDLKPANILLDENMVPKITDFGLSRLFDQEQTIHTANASGTLGYMSPEYLRCIITPKADIFSLGVIIMEVITGHREYPYPHDIKTSSEDFIEHELQKWRNVLQKEPKNISLETYCHEIKRCLQIGLICVNLDRMKRPSMKKIIDMLQGLESMNWYVSNELSSHGTHGNT